VTFVGLESETDSFPAPSQYHLWDETALKSRLAELERYTPDILRAARAFLAKSM
jgi:hypothetical protein